MSLAILPPLLHSRNCQLNRPPPQSKKLLSPNGMARRGNNLWSKNRQSRARLGEWSPFSPQGFSTASPPLRSTHENPPPLSPGFFRADRFAGAGIHRLHGIRSAQGRHAAEAHGLPRVWVLPVHTCCAHRQGKGKRSASLRESRTSSKVVFR